MDFIGPNPQRRRGSSSRWGVRPPGWSILSTSQVDYSNRSHDTAKQWHGTVGLQEIHKTGRLSIRSYEVVPFFYIFYINICIPFFLGAGSIECQPTCMIQWLLVSPKIIKLTILDLDPKLQMALFGRIFSGGVVDSSIHFLLFSPSFHRVFLAQAYLW